MIQFVHNRVRSHRTPTQVLLTVDTEPDNVWSNFRSTSVKNIAGLHRFHRYVCELGLRPTYLVTWSVISDSACVEALHRLEEIGPFELGAHLHAWETPPFLPDAEDREYAVFAHDLPLGSFRAKMQMLTEWITTHFSAPTSYRAGRYGFTAEHIAVLEDLGYVVDTSVTPLLNRGDKYGLPSEKGGKGGRDYRRAPVDPYHPNYKDDLKPGDARLLEVPMTIGPDRPASGLVMGIHRYGPRLLQRAMSRAGVSRLVHASFSEPNWTELRGMLETAVGEGRRVFNFALHSSETMAGGAPWVQSEEDVCEVFERARRCVAWLAECSSLQFATLSEYARAAACPAASSDAGRVLGPGNGQRARALGLLTGLGGLE